MTIAELLILAFMIFGLVVSILLLFIFVVWLFEKAAKHWLMMKEISREVRWELKQ